MKHEKIKKCVRLYGIRLCMAAGCATLFTDASAQYIQKETLSGFTDPVAVVHADGLPYLKIWTIGTVLTRNGATIRHQSKKPNESNLDIDSRVSARFIVAPADADPGTWAKASGFEDAPNQNLRADFADTPDKTGCRALTTGGRHWRLPSLRELLLLLLLKEAVDIIYPLHPMDKGSFYWASSEYSATDAWGVCFNPSYYKVASRNLPKMSVFSVRCISDY